MAEVKCIKQETPEEERITRVAAYCRVSSLPQEESYDSQVEHFTTFISSHPDWELVKVYGDEGITGLNTIKRKGFKKMIKDGKAGNYDLLLVKSISRLGRNTVDLLSSVRELRSAGVTCYFEKENIRTDESTGELMITLLSAFAQMESESISQNVRIGLGYKMQRGEWSVAYSNFLGYDRTDKGEIVINLEGAKTVRFIYDSFLNGHSLSWITNELVSRKMFTGMGTLAWNKESVRRILQNRKYSGDVILQLSVTDDLMTKHRSVNKGQAPQYIVYDGIPAIIPHQTYWIAQGELERRGRMVYGNTTGPDITTYKNGFTGKLKCFCGANYNRVNAKGTYCWKCHERIHGDCNAPILPEEELKDAVVRACKLLHQRKVNISAKPVPPLNEDSTLDELTEAAAIHMENVLLSRIQSFIASPAPDEYDPGLLNLIGSISYDKEFTFNFHMGITICVERKTVKQSVVYKSAAPLPSEHITHFGVTGVPRRRLVQKLSSLTGNKVIYLGFPSFAFMVGKLVVTKDGTVEGQLSKKVMQGLEKAGFRAI